MAAKKNLAEVHLLRGVASLMVCLFHLILGNPALFPPSNILGQVFSLGSSGVEVFFILSGYVVCYSLPDDFDYSQLKTFLLKRIVRIEPPYLVSIVVVISLNFLSHLVTGLSSSFDGLNILGHLAYVNNFTSTGYLNVVYWTLGIEFQFYLLAGLVFPWIKQNKYFLFLFAGCFVCLACLRVPFKADIIVPYFSYFTLGILLLFYKIKRQINLGYYLLFVAICLLQILFHKGPNGSIAAIATLVILHFWNVLNKVILFFSMISYSLFLTHVPVGGKVINLGLRYVHSNLSKYLLVLAALGISIGFAYLFHRFIELPAIHYSKRFRYRASKPLPVSRSISRLPVLKTKRVEIPLGTES
ncbi:MAG: acyltransferase [Chitinophagaceae bacterium]|nr:MAG: acyltransferase [Chitinophagaceae bacterium]